MMKRLFPVLFIAVSLVGCSNEGDSGDVAAATKAIQSGPKSADQLPQDMPPEAKKAAEAAYGQAAAMQQQASDPARLRAMQEMAKRH